MHLLITSAFIVQVVTKSGQLLPLYAMDLGGKIPGFSGLFIAGVVSAALR